MHVYLFTVLLVYIASFFGVGSLMGLVAFPPPPFTFTFPGFTEGGIGSATYTIPWTSMLAFVTLVILGIIFILNVANINIFGSGLKLDAKHLSTVIAGIILSGFVGYTLSAMFPASVPFLVTIFLVWIPTIALVYSVIAEAGGGNG